MSYAVYASDPKRNKNTLPFPDDKTAYGDLLVKICISKKTGLVEDIEKGDESKIKEIKKS